MPFINRNSLPKKECKEKLTRVKKTKQSIKSSNVDNTKQKSITTTNLERESQTESKTNKEEER
jgi:hypothetical protein